MSMSGMHFIYSTLRKGHRKALEWFSTHPYIIDVTAKVKPRSKVSPLLTRLLRPPWQNWNRSINPLARHFNCTLDLRGIKFNNVLTRNEVSSSLWVFIFRQGWQWSWPESARLIPLRTTVLRVTTFEVSIKGFSSLSLTYMLSSRVLKCSCTVQMISLSLLGNQLLSLKCRVNYLTC